MVETAKPKPIIDGGRRSPLLVGALVVAAIGTVGAFFWAINDVAVAASAYPIAERVQKITLWVSLLIGLTWFGFALYSRAAEWTRPASRVALESRREGTLLSLFCVFLGVVMIANYLPEIVWLIDHRAWLKVLAVGPYALAAPYVFVRVVQIVIRDWQRAETVT